MRQQNQMQPTQMIQVPLHDLLNGDKAFNNITEGYRKPVLQNNYKIEEEKTMSDIDISEYLGGTSKRPVQQNNTFYVNMDKTSKAILVEQQKTNKLLGVLIQSVRENGIKIEEIPQHVVELMAADKIDTELAVSDTYDATSQDVELDDSLLP